MAFVIPSFSGPTGDMMNDASSPSTLDTSRYAIDQSRYDDFFEPNLDCELPDNGDAAPSSPVSPQNQQDNGASELPDKKSSSMNRPSQHTEACSPSSTSASSTPRNSETSRHADSSSSSSSRPIFDDSPVDDYDDDDDDDDNIVVFSIQPLMLTMKIIALLHGLGTVTSRLVPFSDAESVTCLSWLLVASGPIRQQLHQVQRIFHKTRRGRERDTRLFLSASLLGLTAILYRLASICYRPNQDGLGSVRQPPPPSSLSEILIPWILQCLLACAAVLPHAMGMSSSGAGTRWSLHIGGAMAGLGLVLYLVTFHQLRMQQQRQQLAALDDDDELLMHSFCCYKGLFGHAQRPDYTALVLIVLGIFAMHAPALVDSGHDVTEERSNVQSSTRTRNHGPRKTIWQRLSQLVHAHWKLSGTLVGGPLALIWLLASAHTHLADAPTNAVYELDLVATAYLDTVPLFLSCCWPWALRQNQRESPFDPKPYQRMAAMEFESINRQELDRYATPGVRKMIATAALSGWPASDDSTFEGSVGSMLGRQRLRPRRRRNRMQSPLTTHKQSRSPNAVDQRLVGASDANRRKWWKRRNSTFADSPSSHVLHASTVETSAAVSEVGILQALLSDEGLGNLQRLQSNHRSKERADDVLCVPEHDMPCNASKQVDRTRVNIIGDRDNMTAKAFRISVAGNQLSDAALRQLACIERMAAALEIEEGNDEGPGFISSVYPIMRRLSSLPLVKLVQGMPVRLEYMKEYVHRRNRGGHQDGYQPILLTQSDLNATGPADRLKSLRVNRLVDLTVEDIESLFFVGERGDKMWMFKSSWLSRMHRFEAPRPGRHNDLWILGLDEL